ncbi:MAG TPA: peptide deformylase [Gemmatimonadales bacterium]|nr:peptide deformylase [Gemmatimonadales bacterium]
MSLLPLHFLGSPVLRERSAEVSAFDDELRGFVDSLLETMDANKGVGLAANQVGVARRVAVVDADDRRIVLVNPVIAAAEGSSREEEGCLSIPEIFGEVTRPERIVLEALDRDGTPYRLEAGGLLARAIQHEIDHLDGILFLDHLSPLKRQVLVSRYRRDHKGKPVIQETLPATARPE